MSAHLCRVGLGLNLVGNGSRRTFYCLPALSQSPSRESAGSDLLESRCSRNAQSTTLRWCVARTRRRVRLQLNDRRGFHSAGEERWRTQGKSRCSCAAGDKVVRAAASEIAQDRRLLFSARATKPHATTHCEDGALGVRISPEGAALPKSVPTGVSGRRTTTAPVLIANPINRRIANCHETVKSRSPRTRRFLRGTPYKAGALTIIVPKQKERASL
jgi:hypothetical protein